MQKSIICTSFSDDAKSVEVSADRLKYRNGAYAIILRGIGSARQILMIRGSAHGKLFPPGGGFEPGETSEQCMRREVKEESGLVVTTATSWNFFEGFIFYEPEETAWHCLSVVFVCQVTDVYQLLVAGDPSEGLPEWIDLTTVPDTDLQHIAKNIIAHVRQELT
jgi:8-oxo-dGTP pyrophosphatase MutT (NUDIX family)